MASTEQQISAIFQAAEIGHFRLITQAFKDYGPNAMVALRNDHGETLLGVACRNGTLHSMQQLFPHYVGFSLTFDMGTGPLTSWLISHRLGMMEAARFFVQSDVGVDDSVEGQDDKTPVVGSYKKVTGPDRQEKRQIFQAVKDGNSRRITQALNDHGPDIIGALSNYDCDALMGLAVKHDRLDIIRLLFQSGVRFDMGDELHSIPPWWSAVRTGHLEIIRFFIENGVDVNEFQGGGDGETPLFSACHRGDLKMARLLLELGADVNKGGNWGHNPLATACFHGNLELVRLLLQHGADVNEADNYGETSFDELRRTATGRGNSELLEELIRHVTQHRWID